MRKSPLFLILIIFFVLSSCSSFDVSKITQEELLELSYKENSIELLKMFFERWQTEIPARRDISNLSKDEKIVYEIFQNIYNPVKENFYAVKKDKNNDTILYRKSSGWPDFTQHFMIVQNSIWYSVRDSLIFFEDYSDYTNEKNKYIVRKGVIEDFRPSLPFTNKVVYLTEEYKNILGNFFSASIDEQDKRAMFIWKIAVLNPSRKRYMTAPSIGIKVNSNFTKALVSLGFYYSGDEVKLIKEGEKWEIKKISRIWIE